MRASGVTERVGIEGHDAHWYRCASHQLSRDVAIYAIEARAVMGADDDLIGLVLAGRGDQGRDGGIVDDSGPETNFIESVVAVHQELIEECAPLCPTFCGRAEQCPRQPRPTGARGVDEHEFAVRSSSAGGPGRRVASFRGTVIAHDQAHSYVSFLIRIVGIARKLSGLVV
ncbi:MAG TPA: hypothetical protein VEJ23_09675 [Solirubrobacteraceae bacterium]|nr:hypothetical protein [Solirubrobacteraceae bacterium]